VHLACFNVSAKGGARFGNVHPAALPLSVGFYFLGFGSVLGCNFGKERVVNGTV